MLAWGLRPRGVQAHLAIAVHSVLPSAYFESVGTLKGLLLMQQGHVFAAQYSACMFLCQRFVAVLSGGSA
jgi:hypothetical protein